MTTISQPFGSGSNGSEVPSRRRELSWGQALGELMRRPGFLVTASILLIAALSLNFATAYLQLYFKKYPVQLSRPLDEIPTKLGPWVQVSKDEALPVDFAHVLGTEMYIFRDYVDSRVVPEGKIHELFDGKTTTERRMALGPIMQQHPEAVMNMAVTYYTGMVDTVAHIPDRCYIADGYAPSKYDVVRWSAFDGREGRDSKGDARLITFEDQTSERQNVQRNVAYFFHANGTFQSDPVGVRLQLQDLGQRYAYYSKVELMQMNRDSGKAAAGMNDFLTEALPEVLKCMPDWKKIQSEQPAAPPHAGSVVGEGK